MAMAAIIPMIATTIKSSINENPSCFLFCIRETPSEISEFNERGKQVITTSLAFTKIMPKQ
jgi:hypothetical protein